MFQLAVCFAAGILCRAWWQPPFDAVAVSFLLIVVALVSMHWARSLAWPAILLVFVALGWTAAMLQPSREDTSLLRYADALRRDVELEVTSSHTLSSTPSTDSEDTQPAKYVATFEARLSRIEEITPDTSTMVPVSGSALVHIASPDPLPAMPCGTHAILTLRLRPTSKFLDPGVWNYADLLRSNGIVVTATAVPKNIRILPESNLPLPCRFQRAQHWSSLRLEALVASRWMQSLPQSIRLNATDASMLRAMLFGDRSALDRNLRLAFERTGSFHLFVVAGIHIAILMAALYRIFLRLRIPPLCTVPLTIAIAAIYAVMTGFGEPVRRALLMSSVYLITYALSRRTQTMNALGVAAFAMLLLDPGAIATSSFQMTVLSVIAVAGIAGPIVERTIGPCSDALEGIEDVSYDILLQPYLAQMRVFSRVNGRIAASEINYKRKVTIAQRIPGRILRAVFLLTEITLLSVIAEMVMALPMAIYFHRLTLFAAPANLLALPLVGFVMTFAIATFLLAIVHPLLALLPAAATATLLHIITIVIQTLGGWRVADVRMPAPALWAIGLACVFWLAAVVLLREFSRRHAYIGLALVLLAFAAIMIPPHRRLLTAGMEFTAIDVGQGDAIFVASPDGRTMVIDTGGPVGPNEQAKTNTYDIGENVVSPYLWQRNLRSIDVLAITHAHSDHVGGALAVLQNFHPGELWLSIDADYEPLRPLLSAAHEQGTLVRYLHAGSSEKLGKLTISILSPRADYQHAVEPNNNDSLVMRFDYGRSSVLAEGDAEAPSEYQMVQAGLQPVTLLKVGHHGSNTSTTQPFLDRLRPQCAIISCGRNNSFGHPHMPILNRLQAMHTLTSRTDTMGAISYILHADGSITTSVLASEP